MAKIKGLGSGIADLLEPTSASTTPSATGTVADSGYREIPLDRLTPGRYQPRQDFDPIELSELARSIKSQGVIQPILVAPFNDGFEIVAGERRWRGAIQAGLATIPAVIRELDDSDIAAITLVENLQRKDLNIIEEAEGLQRLHQEFDMTHEEIAQHTGKSRSHVTNVLRLLGLEAPVLALLRQGALDMGHGRALLGAAPSDQTELANRIAQHSLTVRATEALVKVGRGSTERQKKQPSRALVVREDQAKLIAEHLRAEVRIRETDGLLYDIRIKCVGAQELDSILHTLAPSLSIE